MTSPSVPGPRSVGLPPMPEDIYLARPKPRFDWRRLGFILLGLALFVAVYLSPPWPDAVDPHGRTFPLGAGGKAAIGLFLLAAVWWIFEVVPIGVTSVAIAVLQALFLIRGPDKVRDVFTDFMDPSVWFIFGSVVIGLVFTKTGLTNRLAYRMLGLVGERTSLIYLGCFGLTSSLTLIMAHTAVAATVFPLLMAVYSLYSEDERPTRFGKGLFIGMAFSAGAGSIITLLGSARAAVAIGFFRELAGREIGFFELSKFMLPLGASLVLVTWGLMVVVFRPEKRTIPGLRERARQLYARLGPVTRQERLALVVVAAAVGLLGARSFVAALEPLDKSAIILSTTVLFFLFRILDIKDLENIPWNIILLFGGAMSIGFCLYKTGAAQWLAVTWLALFVNAHWFAFLMAVTLFVLVMTNLIMNVAAIAICLPVALAMAPYMKVAPEVTLYCALAAAGLPFMFLIGAAPNAIAYGSNQFTPGEFFRVGVAASILVMGLIGAFVLVVWPLLGMRVLVP